MGDKHPENLWAVVFSGGRAYVGAQASDGSHATTLARDMHSTVVMSPCYEISVHIIPQRGPEGQPIMSKNISAEPVLLNFEDTPVMLVCTGIMHFADMKEQTRARYKRLADAAEQQAMAARGVESGIVLPKG